MIIQGQRVWYDERFSALEIEFNGNIINRVMPYGTVKADVDFGDDIIMPGLIDIHDHGCLGRDVSHATEEWVREWKKLTVTEGVTSFVPSAASASEADILKGMRCVANVMEENPAGANILGIYDEGPFISDRFPGAQELEFKVIPTPEVIDRYQEAAKGHLIYVMLAPEQLGGDMSVIRYMASKGIRVAIGHSAATFTDCTVAREAGAVSFTHTFNGMLGLHHREPGTAGAAMYYDDMYAELIADGVHVCAVTANLLARLKGKDKLIGVTDSSRFKGYPIGKYELFGRKIQVCEDGVGRLENGTICGNAHTLNQVLKFMLEQAKIPLVTAMNSVTCNPAVMLGFGNRKGYLRPGYDADITVFDENYKPRAVYVMGKREL